MFDLVRRLFESDDLSPHGICLLWRPELLWTHVVADALIGTAYFSIPIVLAVFAARRRDITLNGVLWSFAAFILACGTTHYVSIWTLWFPDYGIEALVKAVTAAISVATAVALWPLLPRALALPSPAQLQFANAALEARIRERDEALESLRREVAERQRVEEQLRQAQKMEAIGQLTGGVAHDFNNLLTVILGNAEILAEEIEEPHLKELAAIVQTAAERGSELNHNLLAFSRRQTLQPKPVRMDRIVRDIAGLLARTLGEHIELNLEVREARAAAIADRAQLESAILNLAINARDAMPNGGVLTIRTEEVVGTDGTVEQVGLNVFDTGSGMPQEVLARAFEPFFTTKEVGKGSGLGLSMIYGFVQQSGGTVAIRSQPGEGTCVTILLPAVESRGGDGRDGESGPASRLRAKVLVVEDAADVRRYVTSTLIALGCEVLEAPDALAGLQLLRDDPTIEMLFTDVVLPRGLSGVDMARRARALRPELKILLTSGHPQDGIDSAGRLSADIQLLRKPYRRKELADAVANAWSPAEPARDRL